MVRLGPAWTTQRDHDSKMNYNTVIKYISCVCTLEHTTTHVEARGWLTRTSSQPLMSSGKQTQASKQLAPLPTELSSAQKSLGA